MWQFAFALNLTETANQPTMNKYRTFIRNHVMRSLVPSLRVRKINITEEEDRERAVSE